MRRRRGRPLNGWLIVDKPSGMTSTQVVGRAKRLFDAQKVGHGGTLDPLATGLLPLAFGTATKTVPYVMDGTKVYQFTLRMGDARDSDDADGAVTATSDVRPTDEQLRAALPALTGDIMQVPPVYSALKVAGERAYDMARDVALACGTVGHIAVLRRLRVGPFTEADAIMLDKLAPNDDNAHASAELLLPVETALADIPALALTEEESVLLRHGRALSLLDLMGRIPQTDASGTVRVMDAGRVLGLGRLEDGQLKPVRIL
ncbi:tRNA pseudouridine synthase B [Acetobacter sp.]|uniref:tRNA pseudouridine synthase B n=1 Tax=Acetobacter sp. TaxID=440 RepID=UPI0039E9D7B3